MMYTMPKNLLSICVNFALATQPVSLLPAHIEWAPTFGGEVRRTRGGGQEGRHLRFLPS